jgi:flavin-dependent dehydrogenase
MSDDCDKPLVVDVCVVGGGPAGSVAAACLAGRGYRVVLIDRGRLSDRVECLPRTCRDLLDNLGVREEIRTEDLMPCPVTRLQWPGPRQEVRVHEQSVLVRRGRFDRMLLDIAGRTCATVLLPARAAPPTWSGSDWRLVVSRGQWRRPIVARFFVDASGRRSGLPRRRRRLSPPTVALSGSCTGAFPAQAEMRVEAIEEGWCWGAFLPDGNAEVSVFLDTGDCAGLGGSDRLGVYRRALGGSGLFGALAPAAANITVCDASAFVDEDPVSEQAIKVGDAAIALDPLSSQGVQAALRSAVQAAAVVHTILSGGDRGAALGFYRNALADSAAHHRTIAAQYYSACDRWPDAEFWRARREAVPASAMPQLEVLGLSGDLPLFLSPDARFAPVPTLTDAVIRYQMALIHPRLTRPVAYIGGVALADLLPGISVGQQASRTVAAWMPLLPRERGRAVLDWLVRTGVLVAGGDL